MKHRTHPRTRRRNRDGAAARALTRAFAAAVLGDDGATARHLRAGFAAGLAPARAAEALRMVHLFAGFPRALTAFEAFGRALGPSRRAPRAAPDRTRASVGRAAFRRIYAGQAGAVRSSLARLDPCVAAWIEDHAYARVLSRPGLSLRERELLAVAALAATRQPRQLVSHVLGALRAGARPRDVRAAAAAGDRPRDPRGRATIRAALRRALAPR